MKNKKFNLEVTPNGEAVINILLLEKNSIINTEFFLKKYKISNFFSGKFFIKRLIKKIFKKKLKNMIFWKIDFWNKITIYKHKTKISVLMDNDIKKFEKLLIKNTLYKRMKDIYKYQKLLNKGINLGQPLFITGKTINYLGGNIEENSILILDGSRRIIANLLSEKNPEILLMHID